MLVKRSNGQIFIRRDTLDYFTPWNAVTVCHILTNEYSGRMYSYVTTDTDSDDETIIVTITTKKGDFFGTLEPVKVPRNPKEASSVQLAGIIERLRGKIHGMIEKWVATLPQDFEEVEM